MRLEALGVGKLADRVGRLLLESGRQGHVDDLAAIHAQQVVVMLGEVFCELEAGELITGSDAPHQSGRVQVRPACAISTRCCSPPDRLPTRASAKRSASTACSIARAQAADRENIAA